MALERPGSRNQEKPLPCSDSVASTYYLGSYSSAIYIDDRIIPPSMNARGHRFHIINQLYVDMSEAVEMIGEKLEEPALEETIAASGLKEHLKSMTPRPGGSIMNRELNAKFLTPTVELQPFRPERSPGYERTTGPFISMGTRYAQARISVYDFPGMLSYTMSNTALQHTLNRGVMAPPPVTDPRLALMDAVISEPAAAGEDARQSARL